MLGSLKKKGKKKASIIYIKKSTHAGLNNPIYWVKLPQHMFCPIFTQPLG